MRGGDTAPDAFWVRTRGALERMLEPSRLAALDHFAPSGDPSAATWLSGLVDVADQLFRAWQLTLDSDRLEAGTYALVLKVRRLDQPCVLRLGWPLSATAEQAAALREWSGRGSVLLLDAELESGAMLLERLNAERTLDQIDLASAAREAGKLLRRLAIGTVGRFPVTTATAAGISRSLPIRQRALGAPIAGMLFTAACAAADRLAARTRTAGLLVHGDLCFANVLRGEREDWLAIDPRPRLGDPELAIPELLWPRVDEIRRDVEVRGLLEAILASGDLDAELARDWALARAADYLLWGLENGLTRDPIRCERVLHALA